MSATETANPLVARIQRMSTAEILKIHMILFAKDVQTITGAELLTLDSVETVLVDRGVAMCAECGGIDTHADYCPTS